MDGKLKKRVGFGLMPITFIFLFEPSYALLDPLPDYIGYIILCMSLINLADVNPRMMEAFCKFRTAALISVIRFVALIVLETSFEGQEKSVISLLLIFVFAVFDVMTLLPAYKKLFEGLLHLATYHDGTAVFECKRNSAPNASERLYLLSFAFVIVKNVLWVLPELTTLASDDTYEFINVLRLFAGVLILAIALTWLVKMQIYLAKIKRDELFVTNLEALYLKKTENSEDFFLSRRISIGLVAFTVAFILSIDIFLDDISIISDVFLYAALIVGVLILWRFSKKCKFLLPAAAVGMCISVLCDFTRYHFFERYNAGDIIRDIEAYNAYYFMLAIYIAEAVMFFVCISVALLVMRDIYWAHTDMYDSVGITESRYMRKRFTVGAAVVASLGLISALTGIFHMYSLPLFNKGAIFELSGIISGAVCVVFIFSSCYFISYVKTSVRQHCKTTLY